MLQQTQVERVIPYYREFTKQFPTGKVLAKAKLSDVLRAWQGLGYNRRAKYLQGVWITLGTTRFPRGVGEMEKLPGIGPYTARAVSTFAFNNPEVFVETNIRTVFFHHLFPKSQKLISDSTLSPLVAEALQKSKMEPREFYAALMDYGSYLKRSGVRLNKKSKHYTKQSKFQGSPRQRRAAKLRAALKRGASETELSKLLK